jgi:hypothetical protein
MNPARLAILPAVVVLAGCSANPCREPEMGACSSVTPAAGSGSRQVFTVTLHGPTGVEHLASVGVLINGVREGNNACYIYYVRQDHTFRLVNDNGLKSMSLAVGGAGSVANSQCRLDGAGSSLETSRNTLALRLNVTFQPQFYGEKQIFVAYDDREGRASTLQSRGSWTVP